MITGFSATYLLKFCLSHLLSLSMLLNLSLSELQHPSLKDEDNDNTLPDFQVVGRMK